MINILVVCLPLIVAHTKVQVMLIREAVSIVEFKVHHVRIVAAVAVTIHQTAVNGRTNGSVFIWCKATIIMFSECKHTTQRDVVLLCSMQCYACTCEKVVALSFAKAFISLISICVEVVLFAPHPSFFLIMAIANISIGID